MEIMVDESSGKTKPNKANRRALPGNSKHEILNPKEMNGWQMSGHNLKKQSQFVGFWQDMKDFMVFLGETVDYDIDLWRKMP